jgi:hypothetical protein
MELRAAGYVRAAGEVLSEARELYAEVGEQHDVVATLSGKVLAYTEAAERAREAIHAAERTAERFFERYARLALGRALCSLGDWDHATAEIRLTTPRSPRRGRRLRSWARCRGWHEPTATWRSRASGERLPAWARTYGCSWASRRW